MASFNKFNAFVNNLCSLGFNMGSDTLKVMLTNTAPVATNTLFGDLTEITAGNGYTAGGTAASLTSSGQTSGTYKLVLANVVFTASGGSIGPFRYAVLYDSTTSSPLKPLIGWWDYGSSISLNTGETFTVQFDATNGVYQLA